MIRAILCGICLAASVLASMPADAGSMNVRPVRHYMTADGQPYNLTIRNESAHTSIIQVELFSWTNSDNTEDLSPTNDLLIAPKIFELPAGREQIVRVKFIGKAKTDIEQSYRMIVTEVPSGIGVSGGVALALRLSMPVFVGKMTDRPTLEWRVDNGSGSVQLVAKNAGPGHVLIEDMNLSGIDLSGRDKEFLVSRYILPGQDHRWPLRGKRSLPAEIELQATALVRGEREVFNITIPTHVKN